MKKKVLITMMLGAAIMMGFGIARTQKDVVKTDAEVITVQTKRVFFFSNTEATYWGAADEVMKINYTTDSTPTTSEMTFDYMGDGSSSDTYMWYFDLPNDVTEFTFAHYDAEDLLIGTSSVVTYSATQIMFMAKTSDNSVTAKTDKQTGFLFPSPDTMRIWVTNYNSNWYGSRGYPLTLRVNSSKHYYLQHVDVGVGQSDAYFYCDIPVGSSWQVYSIDITKSDLSTKASTTAISSDHYKLYSLPTSTSGAAPTDATPTNIATDVFAKVLEGYTTCSDSTINGYGVWANLDTYWYDNLVSTDLSGLTLLDHDVTDIESGIYKDDVYKTTSVSVQAKWDMMGSLYETIPLAPEMVLMNDLSKNSLITAMGVAFISLAACAALYFKVRRHKYN